MKARIAEQPVDFRTAAGRDATIRRTLPVGEIVNTSEVSTIDGEAWVKIETADGFSGFIPGDAKIFTIKKYRLNDDKTELYSDLDLKNPDSPPLDKGVMFELIGVAQGPAGTAVEVATLSGRKGYIAGSAKIIAIETTPSATQVASASAANRGQNNMIFGALWCVGGIVVTAVTYSSAVSSPGGGHYIIAWGAIVFGAVQFFKGLFQSAEG